MDLLATVEGKDVLWGKGYIGVTETGKPNALELPELNLESRLNLGGRWREIRPPEGTDNMTTRALRMLIDSYTKKFGTPPPAITARLERTNLEAFQRAYVHAIEQGMAEAEALKYAIRLTPAGKARITVGYGNFDVDATAFKPVNLKSREGVDLGIHRVPTIVRFNARPSRTTGGN